MTGSEIEVAASRESSGSWGTVTGERLSRNAQVVDFLHEEAALLDADRLGDWLALLTDDISYLVPGRTYKQRDAEGGDFSAASAEMRDDHASISAKVARYETLHAWSEDPPSISRRFVTNVRVADAGNEADVYEVSSNLLVFHVRRAQEPALISARREDRLRLVREGLRLRARVVYLDHLALPVQDLAIFL